MNTSRRMMLAGLGATALAGTAYSQGFGNRNKPAPIAGPYGPAAEYAAARRGVSLLVMQDGKVLFETYPNAGAPEKGWELASGTKSFTGVMAALASADRMLDIDEPAAKTLTEWQGDARNKITIRHLLTLTAGLEGAGEIARPPTYLDAIKATAALPPGSKFAYGPTPFQCFGEIMKRKLKAANKLTDPVAWLQVRLFDGLGIRPTDWKRGKDGNPFMPNGRHGERVDHGADGGVEAFGQTLFGIFIHQETDGAAMHAVDRQLVGVTAAQGLQHPAVAAQSDDHIRLAGHRLAIAPGHSLEGLPGFGLGRSGEVDLGVGHGQVPLRRPAIGLT